MTVLSPEPVAAPPHVHPRPSLVALPAATCHPHPAGDGRDVDLFAYSSLGSQTGSLTAAVTMSETDSDADSEQLASTLTSPPPRRPRPPSPGPTAGAGRGLASPPRRRSPPMRQATSVNRGPSPIARALWPDTAPPSGPAAGPSSKDQRPACPGRTRPAGGTETARPEGELPAIPDARRQDAGSAGRVARSGSPDARASSTRRPPQTRKRLAEPLPRPRRAAVRWRADLEAPWTRDLSPARLELSALFEV